MVISINLENGIRQVYSTHNNAAHEKSADSDETNPLYQIGGNLGTSITSYPSLTLRSPNIV